MTAQRRERADAARNRRMILRAAEDLLARSGTGHVSIDDVAAAAGVGKGTVFRRFGSRAGLMRALVEERVDVLSESIISGPPPLGPGAPAAARLVAFLDAVVEIASRSAAVMAAYEQALTVQESEAVSRQVNSVYQDWHAHISALIAEAHPGLDTELLADILLSSLHSDLARNLMARGETERLTATLRQLISLLLASPGEAARAPEALVLSQCRESLLGSLKQLAALLGGLAMGGAGRIRSRRGLSRPLWPPLRGGLVTNEFCLAWRPGGTPS
jgi:AcrR family transcriptional regulator